MFFDTVTSKTERIDELVERRENDSLMVVTLDFKTGQPTEIVQEESNIGIEEGFDLAGLNRAKNSKAAEKFHNTTLSMFADIKSGGKDSPLQHYFNEIIGDVFKFCQALGVEPHWQQRQLLEAYQNGDQRIAVRSGQGPGKTWTSCVMWLHWLMANPYGLLVITAPTMRQCKDVWLAQARQLITSADPRVKKAYEFTGTGIAMFGHKASDWGCYLSTANKAETFQGIHRERLGIHCEEASGLDRNILVTIQGTLSGQDGRQTWLQIGNPNTRDCGFYDVFHRADSSWTCLHWNGEETPDTPYYHKATRIGEILEEFPRDSDVYRVRVLGEFPSLDPTSMVSLEQLMACTKSDVLAVAMRINMLAKAKGKLHKHIGIDLARYGGDENAIMAFEGNIQRIPIETYSRTDPNDAVDRALMIQEELDWDNKDALYIVDTSGMGEAVAGRLGQKKRFGRKVHEFYSQNCAMEGSKYANKITEAWMLFAKAVKKGEIYLKYDKKTFDQLSKRRYGVNDKGKIIIESKDSYKKRASKGSDTAGLGKSPDRADVAVMAYFPIAEESDRISTFEG